MRVLVTGSRSWADRLTVEAALVVQWVHAELGQPFVVVHGACPTGADALADDVVRVMSQWQVERHPADWKRYGRRAGYVRNQEMIDSGVDVCLAFIRDGSRGATMCADLAERAGIKTRRYISPSR